MKEPVSLSGGNLGGDIVEGDKWAIGEERIFANHRYVRISIEQAVFAGEV